tara:strand:+ start:380 stop:1063 length:684 start_codon:yes stop_codon:yes gene_type:complete
MTTRQISKVTFGSNLAALQFAYQNNTHIILNKPNFPHVFEPEYVHRAWGLLYTKLMLDGRTIGGDTVKMTKITEEEIIVVCESNVVNRFEYDLLFVFDDNNVIGLPDVVEKNNTHKVIDILKVKALVAYDIKTVIKTDDELVNELYVMRPYSSSPIEIYSVSTLDEKQLQNFDYSDTMVRFKSEDLLKQHGFVGFHKNRSKITLETVERIVQKNMDKYEETDKIKFI